MTHDDARAELKLFLAAFGNDGGQYFADGLTTEQARAKHAERQPWQARLAAMPDPMTMSQIGAVLSTQTNLLSAWAQGNLPEPIPSKKAVKWSKAAVREWIAKGCPDADGNPQKDLTRDLERESRSLAVEARKGTLGLSDIARRLKIAYHEALGLKHHGKLPEPTVLAGQERWTEAAIGEWEAAGRPDQATMKQQRAAAATAAGTKAAADRARRARFAGPRPGDPTRW